MPRVTLTFAGEPRGAIAAGRQVVSTLEHVKQTTAQAAAANIAATAKQREGLAGLLAEYRLVAAAATTGSHEQAAAAELAARAELELSGAVAQTTQQVRAHERAAHNADKEVSRLGRGALAGSGIFRGFGRSIAFASTGFLGAFGLAAAARGAFGVLEAGIKTSAQTDAALRSTGGVAGETAAQIEGLSQAEMRKSGIDAALIKQGENWLLTFRQVRDEQGKGNDIFKQATKAAVDLAVAQANAHNSAVDVATSANLVGKALNDPLRGMTALNRVGITFSNTQRKQIKDFMAVGNIMAAQKVILRQLNTEVGGSAKAYGETLPGSIARAREVIRNMSADLLKGLTPSIKAGADALVQWVDEAEKSGDLQRDVNTVVKDAKAVFEGIVGVVRDYGPVLKTVVDNLGGVKKVTEDLIALKFAGVLVKWSGAFKVLAGTEAAAGAAGGTGILGAAGAAKLLRTRLLLLSKMSPILIPVGIAWFGQKFGFKNVAESLNPFGDQTLGPGIAKDAFRGNNPYPVDSPAYKEWERAHPADSPIAPSPIPRFIPGGSAPRAYSQRVGGQTAGLSALQATLPGAKGSNAINYPGHAAKSYHYSGEALDIGDGGNPASLISDWNYLFALRANFAELIWNPPAEVQARAPGSGAGYFWGIPGKFSDHTDHIHVAFTGSAADLAKLQGAVARGKKTGFTPHNPADVKTPQTTPKVNVTALPGGLRLRIANAGATSGLADDIAANEQAVAFLRAKLEHATKAGVKADLQEAINGFQAAIKDARGKLAQTAKDAKSRGQEERGIVGLFSAGQKSAAEAFRLSLLPEGEETKLKAQIARFGDLVRKVEKDAKITPGELASIKTSWSAVSKGLADAATAVADDFKRTAETKWAGITAGISRSISEAWQLAQRDFGRETDRNVQAINDKAAADIESMSREFEKQMTAFDRETQAGLAKLEVAQTPAEKALADRLAGKDATDTAARLADLTKARDDALAAEQSAQAALGPAGQSRGAESLADYNARVKAAQDSLEQATSARVEAEKALQSELFDEETAGFQARADASRAAQDAKTAADQQAYQDQRDALKQALSDDEAAREKARQVTADAEAQAYQDRRDAQAQALQDLHDDQVSAFETDLTNWSTWLGNKQKSYAAFLDWLAKNPLSQGLAGVGADPFTPGTDTASAAGVFVSAGAAARAKSGFAFATGGRVPGRFMGVNDTVMARVTPGEEVIDRSTAAAMRKFLADPAAYLGGGPGGGSVGDVYLDARKVGEHVARHVTTAQRRVISYRSPRA